MKTPIEVKDIRKGDVIRCEFRVGRPDPGTAHATEYVAYEDRHGWDGGQHDYFLLDRPTPPVELPTEPTLGWVDGDWSGGPRLAVWLREGNTWLKAVDSDGDTAQTHIPGVTAFTPAVAVPASALDELRAGAAEAFRSTPPDDLAPTYRSLIATFLRETGASNGDAS